MTAILSITYKEMWEDQIHKKEEPLDPKKKMLDDPALVKEAEKIGVTPAKLYAMREYAKELQIKNPGIKLSTINSRIQQKFKVQIQ